MEMTYELTCIKSKLASLFSLVFDELGYVLAPGNPFKKRDIWKGKVEALESRCTNFQAELVTMRQEVKVDHSLREVVKIHSSYSS